MELKEVLIVYFYNNDKKENYSNTLLCQFLLDKVKIELSCVLVGP